MELVRFGVVVRALRRRRGWRQSGLAAAAHLSQTMVSLVERGHGARVSFETLGRVAASLDARLGIEVRWRGGELDRLLDGDHASISALIARRLRRLGWDVRIEVTYAEYRAAGSIDALAWHALSASLLVIEVKTEITSAEATLRKLDEKVRIAARVAAARFEWRASSVSRLLVAEGRRTARRRVEMASALFAESLPTPPGAVREWLRRPAGVMSGVLFVSPSNPGAGMSKAGRRHRVRRRAVSPTTAELSVERVRTNLTAGSEPPSVLTNRA